MESLVCRFNKFGYCKFEHNCQKRHIDKLCENEDCDTKCENRHPKPCRYYDMYQRCKFGDFCKFSHTYKHKNFDDKILKNSFDDLEKEVVKNKKEIKILNEKINFFENIINMFRNLNDSENHAIDKEEEGEKDVTVVEGDREDSVKVPMNFTCEVCENQFQNETVFNNHIMNNHNEIPQIDGNNESEPSDVSFKCVKRTVKAWMP